MVKRALALAVALAACGTFEEPSIVLDLRVVAMRTETLDSLGKPDGHADQVVDVDLMDPQVGQIVSQMKDTQITAWIADPNRARRLAWSMTLCLVDEEGRCDRALPHLELGAGEIEDPELAEVAQRPIAIVSIGDSATANTLIAMMLRSIQDNPVNALGGVDLTVLLQIGGVDEPRENDIYAAKKLRVSARVPIERAANENPSITGMETAINGGGGNNILLAGSAGGVGARCVDDGVSIPRVFSGQVITLFPNETTGTRENYAAPGLDGTTIFLEESVSYQWLSTYGSWSDETTGGGHDVLGNQSLLGSDWTAPRVNSALFVSIWMIQRDERLGVTPFETCIRVDP